MAGSRHRIATFVLALMGAVWFGMPQADAGLVVIVNAQQAMDSMPVEELRRIYLGHRIHWPDGSRIVMGVLAGKDTHNEFMRTVIRRSPEQFRTHWRRTVFTGAGIPPRVFQSERELVEFVATHAHAIGYIDSTTKYPKGVRVLDVVP